MPGTTFEIEHVYDAPVDLVWKALTDANEMRQWYFNLPDFKAEVGFEFSFTGKGQKGEQYLHLCRVTEVIPKKKLAYSWTYKDYEGYSEVSFELFNEAGKTRLKLTHTGLDSFPKHPDFAKESFSKGWTYITGTALKEYLEKQKA